MVLSHRNHGNFSKKVTCFLNPSQKEKPKCQDFSEKYSRSERGEHAFFSNQNKTQITQKKNRLRNLRIKCTSQLELFAVVGLVNHFVVLRRSVVQVLAIDGSRTCLWVSEESVSVWKFIIILC